MSLSRPSITICTLYYVMVVCRRTLSRPKSLFSRALSITMVVFGNKQFNLCQFELHIVRRIFLEQKISAMEHAISRRTPFSERTEPQPHYGSIERVHLHHSRQRNFQKNRTFLPEYILSYLPLCKKLYNTEPPPC